MELSKSDLADAADLKSDLGDREGHRTAYERWKEKKKAEDPREISRRARSKKLWENKKARQASGKLTTAERRKKEERVLADAQRDLQSRVRAIKPSKITVDPCRRGGRPIDEGHVAALAESIRVRGGLEYPIKVHDCSTASGGVFTEKWEVADGAHRFEAWKRVMGDAPIPCIEPHGAGYNPEHLDDDSDEGEARRERHSEILDKLADLQDNHCRLELDALTRTKVTVQVAELMRELEELGTVRPADPVTPAAPEPQRIIGHVANNSPRRRGRPRKADSAKAIAATTGQSRRTVARDLKRAKDLGEVVLDKIAGTTLAKPIELDALAKLPPDELHDLVDRAAAGEAVSAARAAEAQKTKKSENTQAEEKEGRPRKRPQAFPAPCRSSPAVRDLLAEDHRGNNLGGTCRRDYLENPGRKPRGEARQRPRS